MHDERPSASHPVNEDVIPDSELEKLSDAVLQAIQEGATLKDMYGVSCDTMEAIYTQAYTFYSNGRLDEAESFFRFLCIYDFYNVDYALGLGAVQQLKKRYEKALDIYAMAYTISGGDMRALLYAGQCNFLLKRLDDARRCFETIEQECEDESIKRSAVRYLSALRVSAPPRSQPNAEEATHVSCN
jgi:type III secretion system low calcium response chaperone LcrH/SycD